LRIVAILFLLMFSIIGCSYNPNIEPFVLDSDQIDRLVIEPFFEKEKFKPVKFESTKDIDAFVVAFNAGTNFLNRDWATTPDIVATVTLKDGSEIIISDASYPTIMIRTSEADLSMDSPELTKLFSTYMRDYFYEGIEQPTPF